MIELQEVKNIYITNKQEHNYFIGRIDDYSRIDSIPLIVTIDYYENRKSIRNEIFSINLKALRNKADKTTDELF